MQNADFSMGNLPAFLLSAFCIDGARFSATCSTEDGQQTDQLPDSSQSTAGCRCWTYAVSRREAAESTGDFHNRQNASFLCTLSPLDGAKADGGTLSEAMQDVAPGVAWARASRSGGSPTETVR